MASADDCEPLEGRSVTGDIADNHGARVQTRAALDLVGPFKVRMRLVPVQAGKQAVVVSGPVVI